MELADAASASELIPASTQRSSLKKLSYQRSDRLGGGNCSDWALENDIGTTIRIGRHRKERTAIERTASQGPFAPGVLRAKAAPFTSARAAIDRTRKRSA